MSKKPARTSAARKSPAKKPARKAAAPKASPAAAAKPALKPAPKRNAVVTCVTPNWLHFACFTLLSCAQQGAAETSDFFILTNKARPEEIATAQGYLKQRGVEAQILNLELTGFLKVIHESGVNAGVLLRLTLDQALPSHYARVLYLDSDILAVAPLAAPMEADLKGKALGAVEDWHSMPGPLRAFQDHPRTLGFAPGDRYFNAGVLLLDWQKTLKGRLITRAVEIWQEAQEKRGGLFFVDQDALNLAFHGNWQPLPVGMNASSVLVDYFLKGNVLRHFSAHCKPWAQYWMPGLAGYKAQYKAMAEGSPWPDFKVPAFSAIDVKELAGLCVRRMDFITRARYRAHVRAGVEG